MRRMTVWLAALMLAFAASHVADAQSLDPLAAVVSKVSPAVVRIVVSRPASTSARVASNDSPSQAADQPDGRTAAIGSGFIIDPSGYVATNKHVVENALSITVIDADGQRFPAKLVGMTSRADMALVHIDAGRPLPTVPFGDSDQMHVGDPVVAIGSPFGFDNTVTRGIISAVNRDIMESPFDDYFQTDAAINHGNSGGPLFNMRGEVIGMNSVIVAPGTGFAGLAFSIPSDDLRFVFERLMHTGHINCGMLPITTQQVSWALQQALGAPGLHGALVSAVHDPDGDMLNGQVVPGDVIVSFNGAAVTDPRDLAKKAAWSPIGSEAELVLDRGGQTHTVRVTIHAWPQDPAPPPPPADRSLGVALSQTSDKSIVVDSIDPNGTAADSGLQAGDVVVSVQRTSVTSPAQAMGLFASDAHGYAAVLVRRDASLTWLAVALPGTN
jgi:serine protease Do